MVKIDMEKLKVRLYDKSFIMCGPSCGTGETKMAPKFVEWVTEGEQPITVFTDLCLTEVSNIQYQTIKIAWIIEPVPIAQHLYPYISKPEIYNQFDFILTHNAELLKLNKEKFKYVPLAGHWLADEHCKIHPKTKNLSIIASAKRQTVGHVLRHNIVANHSNKIDGLFGNGYSFIKDKVEGLRDYRYHIVVENIKLDFWFTEKLIDAFLTGCVPIYYGTSGISNFFNTDGMIMIDSVNDFSKIVNTLTPELYYSKINAVKENFETAQDYLYPEDVIYKTVFKDLI